MAKKTLNSFFLLRQLGNTPFIYLHNVLAPSLIPIFSMCTQFYGIYVCGCQVQVGVADNSNFGNVTNSAAPMSLSSCATKRDPVSTSSFGETLTRCSCQLLRPDMHSPNIIERFSNDFTLSNINAGGGAHSRACHGLDSL